jgi:hypothetical protein
MAYPEPVHNTLGSSSLWLQHGLDLGALQVLSVAWMTGCANIHDNLLQLSKTRLLH